MSNQSRYSHLEEITKRERDVLQQLMLGHCTKTIAAELNISKHSVKMHIKNIYAKLGVTNRASAIIVAIKGDIITLPK